MTNEGLSRELSRGLSSFIPALKLTDHWVFPIRLYPTFSLSFSLFPWYQPELIILKVDHPGILWRIASMLTSNHKALESVFETGRQAFYIGTLTRGIRALRGPGELANPLIRAVNVNSIDAIYGSKSCLYGSVMATFLNGM
ncbi:hypothetical protein RRG08_044411 [Elysia crispata]|uniref:Uncharacterized protein n=1 Tax=Elysia crispata TaxID=231223 RepID=A0AAE1DMP2_9GAST|nr:hypothetical protein RRG08_044411 [Elysia crispata]